MPALRKDLRSSSRRACLFTLAWFALLLALLRVGLECIPGARDFEFQRRLQLLRRLPQDQGLCLILGSSRVGWELNPEWLGLEQSCLNFAYPGGTPVQSDLTLERLGRLGYRPGRIILEAWSVRFATEGNLDYLFSLMSMSERQRYAQWTQDASRQPGPGALLTDLSSDLGWPLIYFAPRWLPRYANLPDRLNRFGWEAPESLTGANLVQHQSHFRTVVKEHRRDLSRVRPPAPRAAYQALIQYCRQQRIGVTLLLCPNSPAYRREMGSLVTAQSEEWRDLSRESGIPLVDTQEWGEERDFLDGIHLGSESVQAYCEFVGGLLRRPDSTAVPR